MGKAAREKGKRHQSILVREVLEHLVTNPDGVYVDGTAGSGGHMLALLEATAPVGRCLGIDRDASLVRERSMFEDMIA